MKHYHREDKLMMSKGSRKSCTEKCVCEVREDFNISRLIDGTIDEGEESSKEF